MKVREAMKSFDRSVRPQDTVRLAIQIMRMEELPVLPVCEHGNLLGVVSLRDIQAISGGLSAGILSGIARRLRHVKDYVRVGYACVDPESDCLDAFVSMERQGLGLLYVTENGRLIGAISRDALQGSANSRLLAHTEASPWRRTAPVVAHHEPTDLSQSHQQKLVLH